MLYGAESISAAAGLASESTTLSALPPTLRYSSIVNSTKTCIPFSAMNTGLLAAAFWARAGYLSNSSIKIVFFVIESLLSGAHVHYAPVRGRNLSPCGFIAETGFPRSLFETWENTNLGKQLTERKHHNLRRSPDPHRRSPRPRTVRSVDLKFAERMQTISKFAEDALREPGKRRELATVRVAG